MNTPNSLRYTKDHEWAKLEGKIATVGVTEFAVHALGDITLVELPSVGAQIKAGAAVGTLESVKAVSDMFSPLSGKVVKINEELDGAPQKLNEDCYGAGWMFQVEVSDPAELEKLLDAAAYTAHVATLEG
jgi:glycine cleavage system H protein